MNQPDNPARRLLLQALAAASVSTMAVRSSADPASAIGTRAIPASGELLPVIGLGTYQSFDVGGGTAERNPVREVLRLFVQHGGKLVDSSPMYGPAESVLGDIARRTRPDPTAVHGRQGVDQRP